MSLINSTKILKFVQSCWYCWKQFWRILYIDILKSLLSLFHSNILLTTIMGTVSHCQLLMFWPKCPNLSAMFTESFIVSKDKKLTNFWSRTPISIYIGFLKRLGNLLDICWLVRIIFLPPITTILLTIIMGTFLHLWHLLDIFNRSSSKLFYYTENTILTKSFILPKYVILLILLKT